MDYANHVARMLAHYEKLYQEPGWRQYVEARVADMAARHPELYAELGARFKPAQQPRSSAGLRRGGR